MLIVIGPKNRGCPGSHCNETLFGCCWDKKTPAEGNDEEGCPPKPPACVSSKWGCCKDNVTGNLPFICFQRLIG